MSRTAWIYGVPVKLRDGVGIKTVKGELYEIWHTVFMPTDRLAHKLNVHYETAEVIQNLLLEHDKGTFVDRAAEDAARVAEAEKKLAGMLKDAREEAARKWEAIK